MGRIYEEHELRVMQDQMRKGLNIITNKLVTELIETALVEIAEKQKNAQACATAVREREDYKKINEQLRAHVSSIDATCAQLRKDLFVLQCTTVSMRDYNALHADRDSLQKSYDKAVGDAARKIGEIGEIASTRDALKEENARLAKRGNELFNECEALKTRLHAAQQKLLACTPERGSINHRFDRLERAISTLDELAQHHDQRLQRLEAIVPKGKAKVISVSNTRGPDGDRTTVELAGIVDPETCRKLWSGWD